MPPDIIGLTIGGRYCEWILLDCRRGIVAWKESPEEIRLWLDIKDMGLFDVPEDSDWYDGASESTWG